MAVVRFTRHSRALAQETVLLDLGKHDRAIRPHLGGVWRERAQANRDEGVVIATTGAPTFTRKGNMGAELLSATSEIAGQGFVRPVSTIEAVEAEMPNGT